MNGGRTERGGSGADWLPRGRMEVVGTGVKVAAREADTGRGVVRPQPGVNRRLVDPVRRR